MVLKCNKIGFKSRAKFRIWNEWIKGRKFKYIYIYTIFAENGRKIYFNFFKLLHFIYLFSYEIIFAFEISEWYLIKHDKIYSPFFNFSIFAALQHSSYQVGVYLYVNLYFRTIKHSVLLSFVSLLLQLWWVFLNMLLGVISK